ncbi:MAG: hypothetical protein HeimC3_21220 [Candidatus Heimdallarchaeota archaeon LC_3]|nr:MAG: hypothetical protein HeimC3_21220 [Candidatus Heimdallarchaeota archaeon LC_3]
MKFAIFVDFDSENIDEIMKVNNKRMEQMKSTPEKYFKPVLLPHIIGSSESVMLVVETNDEKHLANYILDYSGLMNIKIEPLISTLDLEPTVKRD